MRARPISDTVCVCLWVATDFAHRSSYVCFCTLTCCRLFHKLLPTITFPQLASWQWKRGVRSTMMMAKGCQGKNSDRNNVTSQEAWQSQSDITRTLTVTKSDRIRTVTVWQHSDSHNLKETVEIHVQYWTHNGWIDGMFFKFEILLGIC